jgi:c-di-GMP-binding flagellar brake protein YcgR
VDVAHDSVFLEYGADTQLAAPFLKSKELCYVSLLEDAKIQFNGTQPQSVDYHGEPAFQIHLPKKLWRMQRRASQRYKLASSTMKITLNFAGVGEIEADAADISADGIGIILYHPHIKLEPGLVIDKCEIRIPQQAPIKVSIRIQYSTTMQFTDGEIVKRSGCQFIGLTDEAKELLESYLSSLDSKA